MDSVGLGPEGGAGEGAVDAGSLRNVPGDLEAAQGLAHGFGEHPVGRAEVEVELLEPPLEVGDLGAGAAQGDVAGRGP